MLTPAEKDLLLKLGQAWNAFCQLPNEHTSDAREFAEGLHRLQDMIAARAAYRAMRKEGEVEQRRNGDARD